MSTNDEGVEIDVMDCKLCGSEFTFTLEDGGGGECENCGMEYGWFEQGEWSCEPSPYLTDSDWSAIRESRKTT